MLILRSGIPFRLIGNFWLIVGIRLISFNSDDGREFTDNVEIRQTDEGIKWRIVVSYGVDRNLLSSLPNRAKGSCVFKVVSGLLASVIWGGGVSEYLMCFLLLQL